MQIVVEIPDDFVQKAVEDSVRRWNGDWRKLLEGRAEDLIRKELMSLDMADPVKRAVEQLTESVIEDSVRSRLRYIVKLAVDNELAAARHSEQLKAEMSGESRSRDRLVAENAELRAEADRAWERVIRERERRPMDDLKDLLAERDRLRALVAQMREMLRDTGTAWNEGWRKRLDALMADPDSQAAAEWLEAEKAKARADGQALAVRGAEGSSWLDREREQAAEPWIALAARMQAAFDRCDWALGRAQEPDVQKEIDAVFYGGGLSEQAGAWLADREAKARAEGHKAAMELNAEMNQTEAVEHGRRQGLAEAGELVREAGCARLAGCCPPWTMGAPKPALVHDPRCPEALAARIEAMGVDRGC